MKPVAAAILFALLGMPISTAPAHAEKKWASCTPVNVMAAENRVHVRCQQKIVVVGEIVADMVKRLTVHFFAAPTSNKQFANRALSLISTALVAGKDLSIFFETDDVETGPQFGCGAADCRPILAIAIKR
jgi:hypothetical protein